MKVIGVRTYRSVECDNHIQVGHIFNVVEYDNSGVRVTDNLSVR